MTYSGSQRIRRHARQLPDHAWVLETDAPYIPPQWLRRDGAAGRNEPMELARIAQDLAQLRGRPLPELAERNRANAVAALPRLGAWLAASGH
jgi:TatD DNase family protein